MNNAGHYTSNMSGEAEYKSFTPSPLPPVLNIDLDMMNKTVRANKLLAELNSASKLLPDTNLFISMYVRKEALLSSQIEGTQCTLEDVFNPDNDVNSNLDYADVVNYVNATDYAVARLNEFPLCNRLLRDTHSVLLCGVRGEDKNPGEFRKSQNWIGASGCSLKNARYIPPNVEEMEKAMSDLEKYINSDEEYDPLIRTALIHYQFETIHPFLDGNGRIGRLLILLCLIQYDLLEKPVIYVSSFLKNNQMEYYDRISEVRRSGNYEQWVRFFIEAVAATAEDALNTIKALCQLHSRNKAILPVSKRTPDNVSRLFDYIEQHPIIAIGRTAKALSLSFNTVSAAVKKLVACGVLIESTNKQHNRVFVYDEYLKILEG